MDTLKVVPSTFVVGIFMAIGYLYYIFVTTNFTSTGVDSLDEMKTGPGLSNLTSTVLDSLDEMNTDPALSTGCQHHGPGEQQNNANGKITIFYNLFVANPEDIPRVDALVREQMAFWKPELHGDVKVTSLGVQLPQLPHPAKLFQNQTEGSENVSLDALWQHCQDNPQDKVAYIHSKGSFHPKPQNDMLRLFLTRAAMSEECANLPATCNVCSARMSPFPHAHTPGNMWVAKCSYVRRLIQPSHFVYAMGNGKSRTIFCDGKGRFSAEHWVHSHPTSQPCDLYASPTYNWGYKNIPSLPEFEAAMELLSAPRFPLNTYIIPKACVHRYNAKILLDEYRRLFHIKYPPRTWWGWEWFNLTIPAEVMTHR